MKDRAIAPHSRMKQIARTKLFLTFTFAISCFELCGCTVLGYLGGKSIDEGRTGLTNGDQIHLVYVNGDTSNNTFSGIKTRDIESYALLYTEAYNQLSLAGFSLPKLRDTVHLISYYQGKSQTTQVLFMGFDRDSVVGLTASLNRLNEVFYKKALSNFEVLTEGQRISYTTTAILDQLHSGRIPFYSILCVQDTVTVPMEQIKDISKLTGQRARFIGLALGAVSDVVIILYAIAHVSVR